MKPTSSESFCSKISVFCLIIAFKFAIIESREFLLLMSSFSFIYQIQTVFHAQPPTPPSAAQQATQGSLEAAPFSHSIKRLFLNWNYILLLISYGMNVGVFYAISTLLNRVRPETLKKKSAKSPGILSYSKRRHSEKRNNISTTPYFHCFSHFLVCVDCSALLPRT